jgi:glyoxylase-like metal-dependent hydrolase (beta-lactamase superfamily II)
MPLKIAIVPVTPFEQNCSIFICDQTQCAAVVDPGGDLDKIYAAIEQLGVKVEQVLITHGHVDHCSAAKELALTLGVPIVGPHYEDLFWIELLAEQAKRFGFEHVGQSFIPERWLSDGDQVWVGQQCLDVIHCPGHTPGHVVFIDKVSKIAAVGDVLFSGSIGRTDFPRGNHQDLIDSIKQKLLPIGDDISFIPGHGPVSTFGHEKRSNPYLID